MSLVSVLARRPSGSFNIRRADDSADADPGLAFMLAQQMTTQLQEDAQRLHLTAEAGLDPEPIISESELSLHQISGLKERIAPFGNYVDLAIRFEAEEVIAALDAVELRLERLLQRLKPDLPWRDPSQIVETMRTRPH
ncbi:MAG TPA: hypothetical protein PK286_11405 [Devosia sp.]|nr:hypothetical protein [Devosia sp.]